MLVNMFCLWAWFGSSHSVMSTPCVSRWRFNPNILQWNVLLMMLMQLVFIFHGTRLLFDNCLIRMVRDRLLENKLGSILTPCACPLHHRCADVAQKHTLSPWNVHSDYLLLMAQIYSVNPSNHPTIPLFVLLLVVVMKTCHHGHVSFSFQQISEKKSDLNSRSQKEICSNTELIID